MSRSADSARSKRAQIKADAAARMSDVKANIDKRTSQVDAKVAASDPYWAEADAAGSAGALGDAVVSTRLTRPHQTASSKQQAKECK